MDEKKAKDELVYQITMSAARKMLEQGLINRDEYRLLNTKMRADFCPIFGEIFADIDLL